MGIFGGLFGDLFDLNGDGNIDPAEDYLGYNIFKETMKDDDDDNLDDLDDFDDNNFDDDNF